MVRVGEGTCQFSAQAWVNGTERAISLSDYDDRYKVLIFYPADFTFVCPTELHSFQAQITAFNERDAQLIAISTDTVHSHRVWTEIPKEKGGIQGVSFPLVSDIHKTISREYGVLDEQEGIALRGLFIIDRENVVQSIQINNLSLGRNINEVLRTLDAIKYAQKHGRVCPANWTAAQEGMSATPEGVSQYLSKQAG